MIFKGNIEYGRTGITLTTGTTTKLSVHSSGFVPFRTNDSQTPGFLNLGRELDVGTTTGHVRCDGNSSFLTGLSYNLGLLLMQFGIEYIVLDATQA